MQHWWLRLLPAPHSRTVSACVSCEPTPAPLHAPTLVRAPCHRPGAIGANLRKLHAAKRAFNKYKPQAVLYVDRLDAGRRDLADLNVSCCAR